jgi:hypothetical protein
MEAVLAFVYLGIHHVGNIQKSPERWAVNVNCGMATYDFDELTRLVLAAHFYAVRVAVMQGGPRQLRLVLHPRTRDGLMSQRHPTIEQAMETLISPEAKP